MVRGRELPAFIVMDLRTPITIRIKDQTGEETYFKLKYTTRMERVFSVFATHKGMPATALRFLLDEQRISNGHTPLSLNLEDQDQIDCLLELRGD